MEGDGLWLLICLVCVALGFYVGRYVERQGGEFTTAQKKEYGRLESTDDDLPLKSYQSSGGKSEVDALREQLRKERENQRKSEEQYKAEIKHLNAQIRDLARENQSHRDKQRKKEETRDLLEEMDQELGEKTEAQHPLSAESGIEEDIDRELHDEETEEERESLPNPHHMTLSNLQGASYYSNSFLVRYAEEEITIADICFFKVEVPALTENLRARLRILREIWKC